MCFFSHLKQTQSRTSTKHKHTNFEIYFLKPFIFFFFLPTTTSNKTKKKPLFLEKKMPYFKRAVHKSTGGNAPSRPHADFKPARKLADQTTTATTASIFLSAINVAESLEAHYSDANKNGICDWQCGICLGRWCCLHKMPFINIEGQGILFCRSCGNTLRNNREDKCNSCETNHFDTTCSLCKVRCFDKEKPHFTIPEWGIAFCKSCAGKLKKSYEFEKKQ